MSLFSSAKAKLAASKLAEEQLYAQAAEEAASGQIGQGLRAKSHRLKLAVMKMQLCCKL